MQCLLFGIKFFSLWSTWTLPYPPSSRLHDNNNNFNWPPPHHLSSCLCLCGDGGGRGRSWGHQCQVPHCGHWAGGPNITNLLDFDRAKTTATITICNRFPHPHGNVHAVVARHRWGRPWQHHCPASAHFCVMLDSHHDTECRIQELDLPHRGEQMQLSSLEPVLDPHWGCLRDAPSRHGARFQGGRISHMRTSFQRSIIIPFLCSLLPIKLYGSMMQYQLQDLAISSMSSLPPQILLGAGTLCAHGQEIVQDVSWLPNFTGWHFHPVHVLHIKFTRGNR